MLGFLLFFLFYQILQIIALPGVIIYLLLRMRRQSIFGDFKQRMGLVPKTPPNKKIIWLHAVSVGEVLSLEYIINQIKLKNPGTICYVTTGTISGKAMAEKNLKADHISFMPYDFLPCMLLAYARIKPHAIILIEAEIWPNFLLLAYAKNIKTYLLNARLSSRSFPRYQKLAFIFRPIFNTFKQIFAQSEHDKKLFTLLGIQEKKITVLGDIKTRNVLEKHANTIQAAAEKLSGMSADSKILLVGSVHPGELDIYLKLFAKLKQEFHELKLILAPRHFHWKHELINKVKNSGSAFFVWDDTTTSANIPVWLNNNDILLVCKLGELFNLYQYADIFFLGGTFVPVGGHNLLEPAVWAKPSLVGPWIANCKVTADQLENAGALIKTTELTIEQATHTLLQSNHAQATMGQQAHTWLVAQAKGVEQKIAQLLDELKN